MRRGVLVLAFLVLAIPAVGLAPTASAAGYCSDALTPSCPGTACKWEAQWQTWRCVDDPIIVCVREPCP